MLKWFLALSNEQIEHFIDIRHNIANRTKAEIFEADHVEFRYIFGFGFSILMVWWEENNHDSMILRLRHADEIEELAHVFYNEPDENPPYPIELAKYIKNA
jgi:hypothetical protein